MRTTFIILLTLFWAAQGYGQQVSVERNVKKVKKDVYDIALTIHKSDLGAYARLKQELPPNAKIEPKQYGSAEFKESDGKAVFTWLHTPLRSPLKIAYRLDVNDVSDRSLTSDFAYQAKNHLATILLKPLILEGRTAPKAEKSQKDAENQISASKTEKGDSIASEQTTNETVVLRGKRYITQKDTNFRVRVTITAKRTTNNVELKERIPQNFSAAPQAIGNAYYSMNKGEITISWNDVPESGRLEASYILKPMQPDPGIPAVEGTVETRTDKGMMVKNVQTLKTPVDHEDDQRKENAKNLWGN